MNLGVNEWQVAGIERAIASLDLGEDGPPHELAAILSCKAIPAPLPIRRLFLLIAVVRTFSP